MISNKIALVFYALKLIVCLEETWNADEQCKFAYGEDASFCQSFSDTMCSSLKCRLNASTPFCDNQIDLKTLSGTVCASGKSCLNGKCINDQEARVGDCLFGDGLVENGIDLADTIQLPQTTITCAQSLKVIEEAGFDPISFCYSNSYSFAQKCCLTCQKIMSNCIDQVITCSRIISNCQDRIRINGISIARACQFTCSNCQRMPLYCTNSTFICKNGGTCQNVTSDSSVFQNRTHLIKYKCFCPPGWIGDLCERRDPCTLNPCENSGVCQVTETFFTCNCPSNTQGKFCEIIDLPQETTSIASTLDFSISTQSSTIRTTIVTTQTELSTTNTFSIDTITSSLLTSTDIKFTSSSKVSDFSTSLQDFTSINDFKTSSPTSTTFFQTSSTSLLIQTSFLAESNTTLKATQTTAQEVTSTITTSTITTTLSSISNLFEITSTPQSSSETTTDSISTTRLTSVLTSTLLTTTRAEGIVTSTSTKISPKDTISPEELTSFITKQPTTIRQIARRTTLKTTRSRTTPKC